jgi:hypothetical protein
VLEVRGVEIYSQDKQRQLALANSVTTFGIHKNVGNFLAVFKSSRMWAKLPSKSKHLAAPELERREEKV